MFSNDITELFRPYFRDDNEIDALYWRIVETVAIHEGLFPVYESIFAFHQLLDFSKFIKDMSIIKGWSCLASERILHYVKQCLPRGGRNSDKTLMERYGPYEDSKCVNAYSTNNTDNNEIEFENDNDVIGYKNGNMYFSSYAYFFLTKSKINTQKNFENRFSSYETDCLYKTLIYEIKKKLLHSRKH